MGIWTAGYDDPARGSVMTADEIRRFAREMSERQPGIESQKGAVPGTQLLISVLLEVSAQLADLNENIRQLREK